jgi:splicing factor U2AF subunit
MAGELTLPNQAPSAQQQPLYEQQQQPTRIVELRNMVTHQDLVDDQEYAEIVEDTQQECSQFGNLLQVVIPRELADPLVFLEYSNPDGAAAAIRELQGRTFDGRQVKAAFFDEGKFQRKEYSGS